MPAREGTYGLLAEFDTPGDLIRAAQQARQDGWRRMDCYTPYPVEEAAEAIGFHRNKVPLLTLTGGLMGLTAMFLLETWVAVWAYPLNIAGRPLYSWPAFIVPAYEWTILFAGLSAAFGMLALNGLPELYHPLFNAPNFRDGATTDKFFLSLVVNIGMWFERFVIVVTSLYRDFLPSSWGTYRATKWDYMTYAGTLGLFTFLFLLFVRFLPMIPMNEIRMMLPGAKITPKATAKAGD